MAVSLGGSIPVTRDNQGSLERLQAQGLMQRIESSESDERPLYRITTGGRAVIAAEY
jgi:DNA-binding PadR family transcriptional regulator